MYFLGEITYQSLLLTWTWFSCDMKINYGHHSLRATTEPNVQTIKQVKGLFLGMCKTIWFFFFKNGGEAQ